MKRVFIIHGWGGSPNEPLLVWLKKALEQKGYEAYIPAMPHTENPTIASWVSFLASQVGTHDQDTHFIGHSIGCQTILRYLESSTGKAGKVILIAPWIKLATFDTDLEKTIAEPWETTPIDLGKVKNATEQVVSFFSDNDPFVGPEQEEIFKQLGHTILMHDKGHFDPLSNVIKMEEILEYF